MIVVAPVEMKQRRPCRHSQWSRMLDVELNMVQEGANAIGTGRVSREVELPGLYGYH
jgi:hypothetical protein